MPVVTVGASALALTLTREAGAVHVEQRAIVKDARERLHPAAACLYHGGADDALVRLLLLLRTMGLLACGYWWLSPCGRFVD